MISFKQHLSEAPNRKAKKAYDDAMHSEDGGDLSVAHNDGDERKARQILQNRGLKGKALDAVVDMMFGESIEEGRVVGAYQDHEHASFAISQITHHNRTEKTKNKTHYFHDDKKVGTHDHTTGHLTVL